MKGLTVSIVALSLTFGAAVRVWAGEMPLSPQARELKSLLVSLKESPKDRVTQTQYLQKFPKDIGAFRRLFDASDFSELYDGADYIFVLKQLAEDHPDVVGEILIGLSQNAPSGADALSFLRQVTVEYGVKHTFIFAKILNKRSAKQSSALVRYLADVENHHAYPEYSQIITNLRKANEHALAKQFEASRTERTKRKGHGKLRDEPNIPGGV